MENTTHKTRKKKIWNVPSLKILNTSETAGGYTNQPREDATYNPSA